MASASIIANNVLLDDSGVWRLVDHERFAYTDGGASEKYLAKVLKGARDLSSNSDELESHIKDWTSEYHLTRKRAQLLSGLNFPRASRVLEVGCGCGAITRYLAETFDDVMSIDGSMERAKIARLRTRDLDTVSIVCAPFHDIRFTQKFDIIFCIGVLEYSASFIQAEDPYEAAIAYFSDMLAPGGVLVVAIENQFGLKYFNGAREDHIGKPFEGIEGYHRWPRKVRTFGKVELQRRLKKHFGSIRFLYPYPDYKVPDCILSEEFLASGSAGELVSQMRSRDYAAPMRPLFDEELATLELSRNGHLDILAHSFLVLASRNTIEQSVFDQEALLFSSGRLRRYSTTTRIVAAENGGLLAQKRKVDASAPANEVVSLVETDSPWIGGVSLQTELKIRQRQAGLGVSEIFAPCKPWLDLLRADGSEQGGRLTIDGAHVDSIWRNVYITNDSCKLIDREWVWRERIPLNVVVIRAIYDFLSDIETGSAGRLKQFPRSGVGTIRGIASALGVALNDRDFKDFVSVEAVLSANISGTSSTAHARTIRWFLCDRPSRRLARRIKPTLNSLLSRGISRLQNIYHRS